MIVVIKTDERRRMADDATAKIERGCFDERRVVDESERRNKNWSLFGEILACKQRASKRCLRRDKRRQTRFFGHAPLVGHCEATSIESHARFYVTRTVAVTIGCSRLAADWQRADGDGRRKGGQRRVVG